MECKSCKREIEENSVFCNWCGAKQLQEKRRQKQNARREITVPKPRQLPSGRWNIQLKAECVSVTETTAALCTAKAIAIRAGYLEAKKRPTKLTVAQAIDHYIEARSNILSPSTLRTYRHIQTYRFQSIKKADITKLCLADLQSAVNREAKEIGPKTLRNAWGLLRAAIADYTEIALDRIILPQRQPREIAVYETQELQRLFAAVRGDDIELAVLLAACLGLRRSEILGLTPQAFDRKNKTVTICQARVPNEHNELVVKGTKTLRSHRVLPCPDFILDKVPDGTDFLYSAHKQNYLLERLKRICTANGLPDITLHGLRHTNASVMLALNIPDKYAMERGGWSSSYTMKNIYQHTTKGHRTQADGKVDAYFQQLQAEIC